MEQNDKEEKHIHPLLIIIAVVLGSLAFLMIIGNGFTSGLTLGSSSSENQIKEFDSIEKASNTLAFSINVPEDVKNQPNIKIETVSNQMLQVYNDKFIFKAAAFVDYSADPLGLYETAGIDNKYYVDYDSTGYEFFRYRNGYPDYPNSKILNWVYDGTAYGILVESKMTEDDALEMLGLTRDDLTKIAEDNSTTSSDETTE